MALRSAVRVQGFLRRLREESGQAAVEYGGGGGGGGSN